MDMRATGLLLLLVYLHGCSEETNSTIMYCGDATDVVSPSESMDVGESTPGAGADIDYAPSDTNIPSDGSVADGLLDVFQPAERDPVGDALVAEDLVVPLAECGNGVIEGDELCDGPRPCMDVAGAGFLGEATCAVDCMAWNLDECTEMGTNAAPAKSCAQLAELGLNDSGVYFLETQSNSEPVPAYCELPGGWTLLVSRKVAPIPDTWGTFTEGEPGPPTQIQSVPFLDLLLTPSEVRIDAVEDGLSVGREVANEASWEISGRGVRLLLSDGLYAVFSDQASTGMETYCIVSGLFDSGFKCDGNDGQIGGVGLFDLFTEDDFCNCDSYGWKQEEGGCEATLCAPTGNFAFWVR
jgi:hypothetical protein